MGHLLGDMVSTFSHIVLKYQEAEACLEAQGAALAASRGRACPAAPHPTYLHVPLQLLQQCHIFIQPQKGFAEACGQDENAWVSRTLGLHELLQLITIKRNNVELRAMFCCLPRSPDGQGSALSWASLKAAQTPL